MIKQLNLYKLWQVMEKICSIEENTNFPLMGINSMYCTMSYKSFLDKYSFEIEVDMDRIKVFNHSHIQYEDYMWEDDNFVPLHLLNADTPEIEKWAEEKIKELKEYEEKRKEREKEHILKEIERLTKRLEDM